MPPRCPCHTGPVSKHPFTSTLSSDAPQMDYCRSQPTKVRHRGQLKLLLSEMVFLQPYRGSPHVVVYAGAAPGLHVPILASMFPEMRFLLIDPHPSAIVDGQLENVVTIEAYMTDQMADELGQKYSSVLFISDVRVGIPVEEEPMELPKDHQMRVHRDMVAQMGWYRRLKPKAGLLKFRLPWDLEQSTIYLQGIILFPVYGRPFTHESRLLVTGPNPKLSTYNNTVYERQMAHFNRVTRPATYTGGKCYDCTAFASVVATYMGTQPRAQSVYLECRRIEKELALITASWASVVIERKKRGVAITLPTQTSTCDRLLAPHTDTVEAEEVVSTRGPVLGVEARDVITVEIEQHGVSEMDVGAASVVISCSSAE